MKRLFIIAWLLLAFALPNHAQTKTDTIKFEVRLEDESATLEYTFSEQVKTDIEIEWVSSNGTESDKFSPDADGKYTQTISGNGTGYIYYTYEQGSTYSAYLSDNDDYYFGNDDIKVVTRQGIITTLDVSDCPALTSLDCGSNQLTDLDVSNNTALTSLRCGGNPLSSLDVSKNTVLTSLSCYSNQLTDLDVSKNTALTSLNCSSNPLTSLNVSQNTALTSLDCDNNQLTNLDVSKNTALTSLDCGSNQLTSLDVSKNTALRWLRCHSNQLTGLDLSNHTALRELYCHSNQLTSLDVSGCTALTWLECNNNQLTDLDARGCTALLYLDARGNHIPLSILYNKVYSQSSSWRTFYADQSDSILLLVDQPLDLSTERIIAQTISSFELTDGHGQELAADFWTENKFVFQFHEPLAYNLVLQNPAIQEDGEPVTFTWYISVVDQIPEGYFTVQIASNNPEWGTASMPGNGVYKKGENVTITAAPKDGYRFVNWTNNGTEFSTEAVYKFAVTENLELIANFEKNSGDVANENQDKDNFYVYAQERNIILSENRGLVQVFNAIGQCVYSGNATIIPVRQSGVYVVRVGANSHKVIVK